VTRRLLLAVVLLGLMTGCGGLADKLDTVPSVPTTTTTAPTATTVRAAACPLGHDRCPSPAITPGQVEAAAKTADDVCPPGTPGRDPHRQIGTADWHVVLAGYGLTTSTPIAEKDHLVAWWAGGASSPRNVWPMLDVEDKKRKDDLENQLFRMVCVQHTLDLVSAQKRMRTYWDDPLW
jgi:hypothetical protein